MFCVAGDSEESGGGDVNDRIQAKLDKLEELKRQQEELAEEINQIKRDIGTALVEEDVTIKTSYVSKRLIQGNITHRSVTTSLEPTCINNNTPSILTNEIQTIHFAHCVGPAN